MGAVATLIPIDHCQVIHEVDNIHQEPTTQALTLLELVEAIGEVTDDEREIVATVIDMLSRGTVRLTGNFHDAPIEQMLKG